MKGDFSRIRLSKKREQEKNYRKVLSQQGRVLTDADWNDYVDIKDNYDTKSLRDILGKNGIPLEQEGSFEIKLIGANRYKIGKGRIYVDGILVENFSDVEAFSTQDNMGGQPHLPTLFNKEQQPVSEAVPQEPGPGIYLAYLDVWDRHITYLEDSDIQESALGGLDTTTRVQNVWQVKLHKLQDNEKPSENKWAPWIPLNNETLNNPVFDLSIGTYNNTSNDLSLLEVFALSKTENPDVNLLQSRRLEKIKPDKWKAEWQLVPHEGKSFKEIELAFQTVNNLNSLHMFGISNKNENENRVFHSTRKDDSSWEAWKEIDPSFSPASAIKVGMNDDGSLELFAINERFGEGKIFSSKQHEFSNDFSTWSPIRVPPDGQQLPGDGKVIKYSVILNPKNHRIEIYVIAADGTEIYFTRQKDQNNSSQWEPWRKINPNDNKKFSEITAIPDRNGHITIFAIAKDKTIWTTKRIEDTLVGNGWTKVGANDPGKLIARSGLSVNYNKKNDGLLELFGVFSNVENAESGNVSNISEDEEGLWSLSNWNPIEGISAKQVYTSSLMESRLDIFAIEAEKGIVHHSYALDAEDWCTFFIPSWDSKIKSSSGKLQARTRPEEPMTSDACMLPERAGYRRLENQLYRIEIHEPKSNGKNVTFKYSRDNGIVCSKIVDISAGVITTKITIESMRKDSLLGFNVGQWIEITDDLHELCGKPGVLVLLTEVKDNDLSFDTPKTDAARVNDTTFPPQFNPKVRRWDSKEALEINNNDNEFVPIEDGIEVKFSSSKDDVYRTGDYWTIPARTLNADIEWRKQECLDNEGIQHHYVKLAVLQYSSNGGLTSNLKLISDCRREFFFRPLNVLKDLQPKILPQLNVLKDLQPKILPQLNVLNDLQPKILETKSVMYWTHGTISQVQFPRRLERETLSSVPSIKQGTGSTYSQKGSTSHDFNWFHFPTTISYPIDHKKKTILQKIYVLFESDNAKITEIQIYDGGRLLPDPFINLNLSGQHANSPDEVNTFSLAEEVNQGIGISIKVSFTEQVAGKIHFRSIGVELKID